MGTAPTDLEAFCRATYNRLFRTLALYTGDASTAHALAEAALARAAASWWRVARMSAPDLWLHREAIKLATSRLRRALMPGRSERPFEVPPSVAGDRVAADIFAALAKIPPRARLALVLTDFGALGITEASEVMGSSERAVEQLRERALGSLSSWEFGGDRTEATRGG